MASLQKPDALTQLVECFQRAATSEQQQALSISDDILYMHYADVLAQSIHVPDDAQFEDEEDISVMFQTAFPFTYMSRLGTTTTANWYYYTIW